MLLHLEKKLASAAAVPGHAINRITPFAADQQQLPHQQLVQGHAEAAATAGSAVLLECLAVSETGEPAVGQGSLANPVQQQLQQQTAGGPAAVRQQQPAPAAAATAAAAPQQHNIMSSGLLLPSAAADGAALEAAAPEDTERSNGSNGSSNKREVIEMAFLQLMRDRPDVISYVISSVREQVYGMTLEAALAAVGALAELPKNWKHKVKTPIAEVQRVVARAAALSASAAATSAISAADGSAAAAAASGDDNDDDGWIENNRSSRVVSRSGRGAAAAAGDDNQALAKKPLPAAWAALQSRRPDVWSSISRQDKQNIRSQLSEEQQLQVGLSVCLSASAWLLNLPS
jgi:Tfp pilus assembly major pilin PilA